METSTTLRRLLRLDATLEAALTLVCVAMAGDLLGTGSWAPPWLSRPLLLATATGLLLAAALLWWLSEHPYPIAARAVAGANAVTALTFLIWALLGANTGVPLRVLVTTTALVLAVLAAAQYANARPGQGLRATAP